jgi:hypothetical protein
MSIPLLFCILAFMALVGFLIYRIGARRVYRAEIRSGLFELQIARRRQGR